MTHESPQSTRVTNKRLLKTHFRARADHPAFGNDLSTVGVPLPSAHAESPLARRGQRLRTTTFPRTIAPLPRARITPATTPPMCRTRTPRPRTRGSPDPSGAVRTPFRARGSTGTGIVGLLPRIAPRTQRANQPLAENRSVSTADRTLPSPKTPSRTHGITRHRASRTSARERTTTTGGESGKAIMEVADRAGRRDSPAARFAFGCPPHAATGQAGRNPTPSASGPIRTTPPACSRPTGKDTAMR